MYGSQSMLPLLEEMNSSRFAVFSPSLLVVVFSFFLTKDGNRMSTSPSPNLFSPLKKGCVASCDEDNAVHSLEEKVTSMLIVLEL